MVNRQRNPSPGITLVIQWKHQVVHSCYRIVTCRCEVAKQQCLAKHEGPALMSRGLLAVDERAGIIERNCGWGGKWHTRNCGFRFKI